MPCQNEAVLYIGNDNRLYLEGLQNQLTGAYINDATVTASLYDNTNTLVTGQTFPTTLSYVAASNGNYSGILEDALALVEDNEYVAVVTAVGGGLTLRVEKRFTAVKRR